MSDFPKDKWIMQALKCTYIIARENGSVWRARKHDKTTGKADTSGGYDQIALQIHKKSGRVYFNMTYMGFTKSVLVNRVIALRFLLNPKNLPVVNHKDGDKENNTLINLEWATNSFNEKHAHATGLKSGRGSANSNAKLSAAQVHEIRASDQPVAALAQKYCVSRSTINNVINKRTWRHV